MEETVGKAKVEAVIGKRKIRSQNKIRI